MPVEEIKFAEKSKKRKKLAEYIICHIIRLIKYPNESLAFKVFVCKLSQKRYERRQKGK